MLSSSARFPLILQGRRQGEGLGGGGLKPPNLCFKKNKGRGKHPTNKKGCPSQTHPH